MTRHNAYTNDDAVPLGTTPRMKRSKTVGTLEGTNNDVVQAKTKDRE